MSGPGVECQRPMSTLTFCRDHFQDAVLRLCHLEARVKKINAKLFIVITFSLTFARASSRTMTITISQHKRSLNGSDMDENNVMGKICPVT